MSETAPPGKILQQLHELRVREFDLSEAAARLPRQLVVHQGRFNKATRTRDESVARHKQLLVDHRAKETTIKQLAQHIDKLEDQRGSLSTPKEFEAIDHEVAHERSKIAALEDEILLVLEEIEQRNSKLPELESAILVFKGELAEFDKALPQKKKDLETDLAALRADLKKAEPLLPREHSATYQRLLSSLGHDCMSKVEERVCLACRATLDMQAAGRVRRGEYLQCPGCGRMLYGMAEE
ncbi:MAG: hypothetical protein NTV55_02825 [Planctomycetota bacterium]|nr:hypothetical protein [Planctomycetota bacterium]RLS37584.1 MAG: hypothetical protein DWH82_10420 [Planctomycetota bacterium]